jgi:hypothetical protein
MILLLPSSCASWSVRSYLYPCRVSYICTRYRFNSPGPEHRKQRYYRIRQRTGRLSVAARPSRRRRVPGPACQYGRDSSAADHVTTHSLVPSADHRSLSISTLSYTASDALHSPCSVPCLCTGRQCWTRSCWLQRPRSSPCSAARAVDIAYRGRSPCWSAGCVMHR